MSKAVALQADVGNIPTNSVTLLSSLSPLLKALSADNVVPLAVVQAEALGACFHINGEFAARVPDLLVRSASMRLQRLSMWVGWMAGDTASVLAQTAGGRAVALISFALVELYGDDNTGELLYQLSTKILHPDQIHSSMIQLSHVAKRLSNKLRILAFGSHLALHVTRIRQVYLNSGLDIPTSLVNKITVETMADFLAALHNALQESTSIMYVEGCSGIAVLVSVVMALCPNDAKIMVEDETIYLGERRKIIISVKAGIQTSFGLETVARGNKICSASLVMTERRYPGYRDSIAFSHVSLKAKGCLSDALDLASSFAASHSTHLRCSIVELIASIVGSFSEHDFDSNTRSLSQPHGGIMNLLGPTKMSRLREKLELWFGVEPSMVSFDCLLSFKRLKSVVADLVPSARCGFSASYCHHDDFWAKHKWAAPVDCPIAKFWDDLKDIIGVAILMLFVEVDTDVSVTGCKPTMMGHHVSRVILRRFLKHPLYVTPESDDQGAEGYSTSRLHVDLCSLVDGMPELLGVSNGTRSIFPLTLESPTLRSPRNVIYLIKDGQFHDRQCYYQSLICGGESQQFAPIKSILPDNASIGPSALGVHLSLTMTVRPQRDSLILRTSIEVTGTTFDLNLLNLHLAYMTLSFSNPCNHNPLDNVGSENAADVVPTKVRTDGELKGRIGLFLTHGDPEAQFLCLVHSPGLRTLFQGNCCLNCAVRDAREEGYNLIIQS